MIYDSGIWKLELKNKTKEFIKLFKETEFSADWFLDDGDDEWSENYKFFIEIQKYCFYAAVISRKFIESNRLSDELISKKYSIKVFNKTTTSKIITKENFESIEEDYNLNKTLKEELTLEKICHFFIHSFIFNPKLIEYKIDNELPDDDINNWEIKGIEGLYINTDHTKDKKIYFFELTQIFEIFTNVYEDQIIYIYENRITGEKIRSRNHQTGDKEPKV